MEKKKVISVLAVLILTVCVAAGIGRTHLGKHGNEAAKTGEKTEYEDKVGYISSKPFRFRYERKGTVDIPEGTECEEEIVLKDVREGEFELLKKRGEDIGREETLYRYKDREESTGYRARLLGVSATETEKNRTLRLRLLNYEKLGITVMVPKEEFSRLSYDTGVQVEVGGSRYDSAITEIDWRMEGDTARVQVGLPAAALSGTPVKVTFDLGELDKGLRCEADFVFEENGLWYVCVREYGELVKKQVDIGERFTIGETVYVQITQGDVIDGDEVHIPREKEKDVDHYEELKELLKH